MATPFQVLGSGGINLAAKMWSPTAKVDHMLPMIVFIHQYSIMGGSGLLMEGMARAAASRGYTGVTFDLRGAGASGGSSTYTNFEELNDVKTIIDDVILKTNKDVVVIGSSGGAALAGAVLDYSERVKAVCTIGYTWGWWSSWIFGYGIFNFKIYLLC